MRQRSIVQVAESVPIGEGVGVTLRRAIGTSRIDMLDPFLLLDEFFTDRHLSELPGFPAHPHRGFATVSYVLEGSVEHQDSAGNHSVLRSGDVQWMSAGRGIIHSEMPRQEAGMMRGFQLWVNLPASEKMSPPRYQNISAKEIPVVDDGRGGFVKVIAGQLEAATGPITSMHTRPLMLDIKMGRGGQRAISLPHDHSGFIYVFEGSAALGADSSTTLERGHVGVLGPGDELRISSEKGGRILLLAAAALKEPVARRGPFVMNTREELDQAFTDFRNGRMA